MNQNWLNRSGGPARTRSVLGCGLLAAALVNPATAQNDGARSGEDVVLEQFTVTGSRIKRIDTETPQPVVRITTADFEATGFTTLGDAIRAMPMISGQSLVSVDAGTSFTPGVSSFNLRGLGNNNTLVLVNGRRAAPFASAGFNGFQTVFDFNSIPTAAIESLEVLKDGASAIYGSDAVAGVINVTLKKNYEGLSTELSLGNTIDTDSFERGAFLIFGTSSGKMSNVTTFDWRQREAVYARDLDYADEADGRPYGGFDQGSSRTPIARVYGLADRVTFPGGRATFATPTTTPTIATAVPHLPQGYNFQEEAQFLPAERMFGFYTRTTYDFTDALTGFAELSFRRSEVDIDSASTPLATTSEQGDAPGGGIVFPATNPFNPFGQDIVDLRWRMQEVGNRQQQSQSDTPRIVLGLEGDLPFGDWSWQGGMLYTKNSTVNQQGNYVADRLVQDAFNGVVIEGQTLYANPFGPNDPRIIDYMRVSNPTKDDFEVRTFDVSSSGSLFDLPGGAVSLAVGAESRREEMSNVRTGLNKTGGLVGGGEGSGSSGNRRVFAGFMELSLPVHDKVEVQLAGRFEDYSDFGNTTKPKAAVVFRPIPEVLVRGSYGQSFLAPNLAFLYTAQSTSFTANTLADPLRPNDPRQQIKQLSGGNPDLQPEDTDVTYAGIVLQPFVSQRDSLFREFSIGVDYIKFDQENLLGRLAAEDILGDLDLYGHLVIRNAPAPGETVGTINAVSTTWQNLNNAEYEAYDFNLRWVLPENGLGQFRFETSWTHLVNFDFNGTDQDGTYSFPLNRGNFTAAWNKGDWAASIYVNYIGSYEDNFAIGEIKEQFVVNPQVAYSGFKDTKITLGVRNALNDAPPLDISDSKLINENTNYVEPLFWYVRVSKDW